MVIVRRPHNTGPARGYVAVLRIDSAGDASTGLD